MPATQSIMSPLCAFASSFDVRTHAQAKMQCMNFQAKRIVPYALHVRPHLSRAHTYTHTEAHTMPATPKMTSCARMLAGGHHWPCAASHAQPQARCWLSRPVCQHQCTGEHHRRGLPKQPHPGGYTRMLNEYRSFNQLTVVARLSEINQRWTGHKMSFLSLNRGRLFVPGVRLKKEHTF